MKCVISLEVRFIYICICIYIFTFLDSNLNTKHSAPNDSKHYTTNKHSCVLTIYTHTISHRSCQLLPSPNAVQQSHGITSYCLSAFSLMRNAQAYGDTAPNATTIPMTLRKLASSSSSVQSSHSSTSRRHLEGK